MNSAESKFRNTSDKMTTALVELLESKEFADISITDICKKASVNRSTFYSHYDSTYDLLHEAHQKIIDNFFGECDFDSSVDISHADIIAPEYLLPYLKYIRKHKRLFRIYTDNSRYFEVNKMDDYLTEKIFVPIYSKHGVSDKKLIFYM